MFVKERNLQILELQDHAVKLVPITPMTLEQSIEFIGNDELVEVTPESIRIRKRYLDAAERKRMISRGKK